MRHFYTVLFSVLFRLTMQRSNPSESRSRRPASHSSVKVYVCFESGFGFEERANGDPRCAPSGVHDRPRARGGVQEVAVIRTAVVGSTFGLVWDA